MPATTAGAGETKSGITVCGTRRMNTPGHSQCKWASLPFRVHWEKKKCSSWSGSHSLVRLYTQLFTRWTTGNNKICRLPNISLCYVENGTALYLAVSLIWQRRIHIKGAARCYVNGVIETFCKYLQSARRKHWLADGSTLRAWHLPVRQFRDKVRRIIR